MSALIPYQEVKSMAHAMAASGLFGMKTPEQAEALMLIAQANGQHPAAAARDYDVIQGRPSKKAEAMLRDFLGSGGKVEWHEYSDKRCDATFSHPQGGTVRVDWDMARATKAGLAGKDMYKKFSRNMFRSRCISEGVRTVYPMATGGMHTPEENAELVTQPAKQMGAAEVVHPEPSPELLQEAREAAVQGVAHYSQWWAATGKENRKLLAGEHEALKQTAADADAARTVEAEEVTP